MIIYEYQSSAPQFADCLAIRVAVFVQEQHVPLEEEHDEHDRAARHFLALADSKPVGTARLLMQPDGSARIGRVAVLASSRGTGVGAALMRHVEAMTTAPVIILDAQIQAMPFYAALGYTAIGEAFMEAGIAHCHMRKYRQA